MSDQTTIMLAEIRKHSRDRTSLPAGTKMASDLAPIFDQRARVEEERRAVYRRVTELELELRGAARANVKAVAASLISGEEPKGVRSIPEIEAEIAEARIRLEAGPIAAAQLLKQADKLRRANREAYAAELEEREQVDRLGVLDAIEGLEAAWRSLASLAAARDWLTNEDAADVRHPALPGLNLGPEPNLVQVFGAMRAVVTTPKREPRPTVDEDGDPMTGWTAWAKAASGQRKVGPRRPPSTVAG